jgi:DNA-binding Lrp family transcriptional regulator
VLGAVTTTDRECVLPEVESSPLPQVSREVLIYLAHTDGEVPIRQIARSLGCAASTVLRRIRKVEAQREDPLVELILQRAGNAYPQIIEEGFRPKEFANMLAKAATKQSHVSPEIEREARRILRRLCESGAFLAVAPGMEKAVVMREVVPGRPKRIAVVETEVAHAFAVNEWILCARSGKIACYEITSTGRSALKRLLASERVERNERRGVEEEVNPFAEQHQVFEERKTGGETSLRYNLAESPLAILARKRNASGEAWLNADLIEAGERLREDFEQAQMGPRVAQNWERFLTSRDRGSFGAPEGASARSMNARDRVMAALEALGPGLADIVFRVCCFLEGLETAEKRMGWTARSGKVVLRIALQRLAVHYGLVREFDVAPELKAS